MGLLLPDTIHHPCLTRQHLRGSFELPDRTYVVLKCAMSLDGYIDDATEQRLLLSSTEDFARVDVERARVDAILVGANTIRKDNPRLMVRSEELRQQRRALGIPETPMKVTFTRLADFDPAAAFFTAGYGEKIVYVSDVASEKAENQFGEVCTIVSCGESINLADMLSDLTNRGVGRLMVEGGGTVHTQFLKQDLVDEIQVSIAPFFVGDSRAPRFVYDGQFPYGPSRRMRLLEVAPYGDCVYVRYGLSERAEGRSSGALVAS